MYGEGMTREERIRKAHEILDKAGYTWKVPPVKANGEVGKGEGIKLPDGSPMANLTILTPPSDYDPHRAMAGLSILGRGLWDRATAEKNVCKRALKQIDKEEKQAEKQRQ